MNIHGHDKVSYFLIPIITISSYLLLGSISSLLISFAFAFASLMFNGDLDTHSTVYNRWLIFKYIWKPYRYLNHRSFFTHGPIIGTTIRILWLSLFILPILLYFYEYQLILNYLLTQEFLYVIIGLELGAMNHSITDLLYSTGKRLTSS